MKSVQFQALTGVPFVEKQNCNPIQFQPAYATDQVAFNVSGPIVVSAQAGTILAQLAAAADGTTLVPYLLPMLGSLTFTGTCRQGKGLKVNQVPIWLLWLENYIENKGNGPVVDDGGLAAAGFVAGTYNVSINFNFTFYDPLLPVSQRGQFFYRPSRYDKQPTFNITGGALFAPGPNYKASSDFVALTSDSTSTPTFTYSMALTVNATARMIPSFKFTPRDLCFDRNYEYYFKPNAKASDFNGIVLADLGVQMYILQIVTELAAAGGGASTNLVEKGNDIFGTSNQGKIDTTYGNKVMSQPIASNLKADNIHEFMTSLSAWPEGVLVYDEYGHNTNEWKEKTFLEPTAPAHIVDQFVTLDVTGNNNRILHMTAQPSQSAIDLVGANNFPKFQGA